MVVFVINKHGEALMPCKSRKARLLLKQKKAKIISYKPFAIQLLYGSRGHKQKIDFAIDSGAKHVGVAIAREDEVLTKGEIEFRSDVSSLLKTRSDLRRGRRSRNLRYRRSKFKYKTSRVYSTKKKKWVKRKLSFESSRPKGWLPPSIQSRVNNTFRWIDKFAYYLPEPKVHIEVGKFDVQKMIDPTIKGISYQRGQTYGYHEVRYFVFARDKYTCQVCKKKKDKILNTHHITFTSEGGSNRADNLITVCTGCHSSENHKKGKILHDWMIQNKKTKSFKETPFMNTLRIQIFDKYPNARITYGSETTPNRKRLGLDKTHANDAIAISGIARISKLPDSEFKIKQFRKKKRSLHEATARKRKNKNTLSERNEKNTKMVKGFYLNDLVLTPSGEKGYITGFTGETGCYIKSISGEYISLPGKTYKQQPLSKLKKLNHNNNWQHQII